MTRSKRSSCTTSRARCGVCTDTKQAHRRAREVEQPEERSVCQCRWITMRKTCPMCGLPRAL